MIGVKFGDFDMQANGVTTTATDVYSAPPNDIQADELPEADGAVVVKQRFTSKTFSVEGYLSADTRAELEALMDDFKQAMSVRNQAFDIDYAGGIRRYLCNAKNVMIADKSVTRAGFSVEMLSPDGMGWDLDSTSLLTPTSITSSSVQIAITVGGTYRAEPLITATINTFTGTSSRTVTISNGETLRSIAITRTWTAGDVIEIDSLNKTIYVNNSAVEFTGQFPRWDVGAGSIGWLDTFTARDVTLTSSYTRRWL